MTYTYAGAVETLAAIRAGRATAGDAETIEVPVDVVDAIIAPRVMPENAEPAQIRDALQAAAAQEVDRMLTDTALTSIAPTAVLIESLLAAAAHADEIDARRPQLVGPGGQPPINVERLAGDVWHAAQEPDVIGEHFPGFATQDGFAASAIADVAAGAVRKVLS